MPGPVTDNFGWQLPEVDGDEATWGDVLNAALAEVDEDLQAVSDVAGAALPKAGGIMEGRADLHTATMKTSHKGAISGATTLDLAEAQYFSATVTAPVSFVFDNTPVGEFMSGFILRLINGGAHAITWPASVEWPGGVVPELTESGTDILVFTTDDDGATWRGVVSALDVR